MTQFASTLYPQTNPSNVILLNLRECCEISMFPTARVATAFLNNWDGLSVVRSAAPAQRSQARRVIERLANLSG